jgi:multidrug efflux system membrane fusion protein
LRLVDPGNVVQAAGTVTLAVITQLQPITVIFTIPEDNLGQVQPRLRQRAKLAVEAYDRAALKKIASGSLLTLDNQIDTTTGTVKAKAVFDNRDGALFPNQFVNIRLILQEKQNAIVIPAAALQTGTQGNFVYLLKEGQPPANLVEKKDTDMPVPQLAENQSNYYVEAQTVNVELTEGTQVILNGGVKAGDQIVVDGQEKLKNGSKVFPKTAPVKTVGATAEVNVAGEIAGQVS